MPDYEAHPLAVRIKESLPQPLRSFFRIYAADEVTSTNTVLKEIEGAGLKFTPDDEIAAKKIDDEFNACMDDDFNTALAISNLFGYFKEMKKYLSEKDGKAAAFASQIRKTYSLLGFFKKDANAYVTWYDSLNAESVPEEVKAVAEERWQARLARDWAKSDELRAKLAELGYSVKDSKEGYELIKNS
jgi:cysteinyl-tRNA synthetase